MNKEVRMMILYDYYGELLTVRQKECFYNYYFLNLSLKEISDLLNISRTAISNQLKIVEEKLEYYESVLHLYQKEEKLKEEIENLEDLYLKNKIKDFLNIIE